MTKNSQQGFTLLELVTSMAIFLIIMGTVSGIFASILRNQRRVLSKQLIMSNTSYALEYMGRALRMAKKDTPSNQSCLSETGLNYENPDDNQIKFLTHDEKCVTFKLENDQIKGVNVNGEGKTLAFTSDDLNIQKLKFTLNGQSQENNLQPTITIFFRVETPGGHTFSTQTTITQRNLDVQI